MISSLIFVVASMEGKSSFQIHLEGNSVFGKIADAGPIEEPQWKERDASAGK